MRLIAPLLFGLLATVHPARHALAMILASQESLEYRFSTAETVVLGQLVSADSVKISDGKHRGSCGRNLHIRVIETFKGTQRQNINVSVYASPVALPFHAVTAGDQYLLFLKQNTGVPNPMGREVGDVIWNNEDTAWLSCRQKLSRLSLIFHPEAGYLIESRPGEERQADTLWFAFVSIYTGLPERLRSLAKGYNSSCSLDTCTDPRMRVPWKPVRQQLLRWKAQQEAPSVGK